MAPCHCTNTLIIRQSKLYQLHIGCIKFNYSFFEKSFLSFAAKLQPKYMQFALDCTQYGYTLASPHNIAAALIFVACAWAANKCNRCENCGSEYKIQLKSN